MGVGMVRVAMDNSAPLDGRSSVLLNPGDHAFGCLVEVNPRVFWRNNDLEDALIAGPLPAIGQRSQWMFLSQAETVGIRHSRIGFQLPLPLFRRVPSGALTFDIGAVGLPAARRPGRRISDIHNGPALKG
jgi:hypothetical protein